MYPGKSSGRRRWCAIALAIVASSVLVAEPAHASCDASALSSNGPTAISLVYEADVDAIVSDSLSQLLAPLKDALNDSGIEISGLAIRPETITFDLVDPNAAERTAGVITDLGEELSVSIDGPSIAVTIDRDAIAPDIAAALIEVAEVMAERLDNIDIDDAILRTQGAQGLHLQFVPPDGVNPEQVVTILSQMARITFHLVANASPDTAPQNLAPEHIIAEDIEPDARGAVWRYVLERDVLLTGDMIEDAEAAFDYHDRPAVNFRFDDDGRDLFDQLTTDNIDRQFAMVLDGKVITAPSVREPILGGSGQITGNFTIESAHDLALLMRVGALPIPLTLRERWSAAPADENDAFDGEALLLQVGLPAGSDLDAMCERLDTLDHGDISLQEVSGGSMSDVMIWVELAEEQAPDDIVAAVIDALGGQAELWYTERAGPMLD